MKYKEPFIDPYTDEIKKTHESDGLSELLAVVLKLMAFVKTNEYPVFPSDEFQELTGLFDELEYVLRKSGYIPKGKWPH